MGEMGGEVYVNASIPQTCCYYLFRGKNCHVFGFFKKNTEKDSKRVTKKSAKLTGVRENAALAVSGQFTVQEDCRGKIVVNLSKEERGKSSQ